MKNWSWLSSFVLTILLALPAMVHADVKDNAAIFSKSAVDQANDAMTKLKQTHNKELVIETFAAVPDGQPVPTDAAEKKGFFDKWAVSRGQERKVNGVYVLICMNPTHLEVKVGKNTLSRGDFTQADADTLRKQLQTSLHDKQYDQGLADAVENVDRAYTANINGAAPGATPMQQQPARTGGNTSPLPGGRSSSGGMGLGLGSLLCLGVAAVVIFSIIRAIFRGRSGGGYGGGPGGMMPPGGQNMGQGYGQGYGGAAGGGGGGFGRGILGGLLGGALGGYAENRFEHRNDPSGSGSSQAGWGDSSANAAGGGGSFDSGPSDAGQMGDAGSGGDFGSSGGGGGGDSGGSSGGDF